MEIVLPDGLSIAFNASALHERAKQNGGMAVAISAVSRENAGLTKAERAAVGDRPAYDISVISGGRTISNMGGEITVTVPYELKDGERAGGLIVYYVDREGNRERCVTSYDAENKRVSWQTDHLSLYMIDYDEKWVESCDGGEDCPISTFTDLNSAEWYHDGVHFCIENDLMIGTSDDLFAPNGTTTRAQIVTILWRLAGEPVVNYLMQFEDVEAETWYTEAVRWASAEGIVLGYSDTAFGPNDPITREQLATILYRYEQYKGGGFTGAWMIRMDYVDLADVSDWAYEAMCWMSMNEVVTGKPGKILDPKGSAVRAEAASMLYQYWKVMTVETEN